MKENRLTELSDEELLNKRKQMKAVNIASALLLGMLIGVSIYITVKNGVGVFTFFPLFFLSFGFVNRINTRALEKEIATRNLK